MDAITVKNLTKKFDDLIAVNDISFTVKEGEIFGLLGPNGAGKTTIIKMLATMLKKTSGVARVLDWDVGKNPDEVRRSIGIVFQDPSLDDQLTGKENLDFHARMYGVRKKIRKERIEQVLNLVDLFGKKDILVNNYSGGMRRRLEIARGLMHYPRVLFLDEPTLGLDTQTRRAIWEHIIKLNHEEKITVILTTHYMDEADFLCNRVAIIDEGKILVVESPENLKNMMGEDIISIGVSDGEAFSKKLSSLNWIQGVSHGDGIINLSVKRGEEKIPLLINFAQKENLAVQFVSLHKPTLEDVFIDFTGRNIREENGSTKTLIRDMIRARTRK